MSDRDLLADLNARRLALRADLRTRGADHLDILARQEALALGAPVFLRFRDKWTNESWEIPAEASDLIVPTFPAKLTTAQVMAAVKQVEGAKKLS